jgi:hypothetical protein
VRAFNQRWQKAWGAASAGRVSSPSGSPIAIKSGANHARRLRARGIFCSKSKTTRLHPPEQEQIGDLLAACRPALDAFRFRHDSLSRKSQRSVGVTDFLIVLDAEREVMSTRDQLE